MDSKDDFNQNNQGYFTSQEECHQYQLRQYEENQRMAMMSSRNHIAQYPPKYNIIPPHLVETPAGMQRMPPTYIDSIGQYAGEVSPLTMYQAESQMIYNLPRGAQNIAIQPQVGSHSPHGYTKRAKESFNGQIYDNHQIQHHHRGMMEPQEHYPSQHFIPRQALSTYMDAGPVHYQGHFSTTPGEILHQQHIHQILPPGYEQPTTQLRYHPSHSNKNSLLMPEEEKQSPDFQKQNFRPDFGGNRKNDEPASFPKEKDEIQKQHIEFERHREIAIEEAALQNKQKRKLYKIDSRESNKAFKNGENYSQDLKMDQMQQAIKMMQSQMSQLLSSQNLNQTKSFKSKENLSNSKEPTIVKHPQFSHSDANSDRSYNNSQQYPINSLNYNQLHTPKHRNNRHDVIGSVPFIERQNSIANYRNHFLATNQEGRNLQGKFGRRYQAPPDPDYVSCFQHHSNHHDYSQLGQTSNVNHVAHDLQSSVSNMTNYNYRGKFNIKSDNQSYYGAPISQSIFHRGFNYPPQVDIDGYSQKINQEIYKIISDSGSNKKDSQDKSSGKVPSNFSNQWENDAKDTDVNYKFDNVSLDRTPRSRGFSVANNIFYGNGSPNITEQNSTSTGNLKMGQQMEQDGKQQRSQSFPDIKMAIQYNLKNQGRQNKVYELHQIQEEKNISTQTLQSDLNSKNQLRKDGLKD